MNCKKSGMICLYDFCGNGKDSELYFATADNNAYRIGKNYNWEKLRGFALEAIEAWGVIKSEILPGQSEMEEVFYIKRFSVKRGGVSPLKLRMVF